MKFGYAQRVRYRGMEFDSIKELAEYTGYSAGHTRYLIKERREILGHPVELLDGVPIKARKVECLETGEIFESVKEASDATEVLYVTMYNRIKYGVPTDGKHYRFV